MGGPHTQSVWSARRQIPTHQSNPIKWSPSDDRRVDRRTPIFRLDSPLKTFYEFPDHDDGQQKAPTYCATILASILSIIVQVTQIFQWYGLISWPKFKCIGYA